MNDISIVKSSGRGKNGWRYYFIHPSGKCSNKSRRVRADKVKETVARHFSVVKYFSIDGIVIGAKDKEAALKEYWRVCERDKIGKRFEVTELAK